MDQHVSGTGLTSIEILKRVNAGGCTIPVILVTTLGDDSVAWAADDAGAAGFLHRDLDMTERTVKHAIRYSISHFRQLQEIQEHMAEVQKQLADMGRKLRR
jgi:FixJ family two-component response regulator